MDNYVIPSFQTGTPEVSEKEKVENQKKEEAIRALWEDMNNKYGDRMPLVFAGILNRATEDNWALQHIEKIVDSVSEHGGAMRALMEVRNLLKNRAKG